MRNKISKAIIGGMLGFVVGGFVWFITVMMIKCTVI